MIPCFRGITGTHPQGLAGLHPFPPLARRDLLAADRRALSSPSALLWHLARSETGPVSPLVSSYLAIRLAIVRTFMTIWKHAPLTTEARVGLALLAFTIEIAGHILWLNPFKSCRMILLGSNFDPETMI